MSPERFEWKKLIDYARTSYQVINTTKASLDLTWKRPFTATIRGQQYTVTFWNHRLRNVATRWLYRRETVSLSDVMRERAVGAEIPATLATVFFFLTYQIAKECTRYSYHAIQKSSFARRQIKLCLHDFWHERRCSCGSKMLQADTQCDEYEWKSWKHQSCCLGKIFQLGVASFFFSFFCFIFFCGLREKTRHFLFDSSRIITCYK